MRTKRYVVLVGILFVPMAVGGATRFTSTYAASLQGIAVRDTTGCLDTLRAGDSVSAVVTMSVRPQDSKVNLPSDFEGLFVQEFRSRLKVPHSLPLSVMMGWTPCDSATRRCVGGVLMLGARAYAVAHSTGTLSRIGVVDLSLTPAFSDSVRAALEWVSEEKLSPFFKAVDSIPLEISIGVQQHSDTVPPGRHLFRVTIPHYSLPFTNADLPKNTKGPKYPSKGASSGVGDTVTVTFAILPDGSVAPRSVDVQKGRYADFIRSVLDRLVTTRYLPARIGGCAVASWQAQTFVFVMGSGFR